MSSFVGAFGGALRETRLTALLGYLVALEPRAFMDIFGFTGIAMNVVLEHRHGVDRSDIIVETTHGRGVIEAKVGTSDPLEQSSKYGGRWTVLLTQHMPAPGQKRKRSARYVNWKELAVRLKHLSRSTNPKVSFVSKDLLKYLEEHHMIRQRESVEIYAREINEPTTLALFLKAHMYGCRYEQGSRLPEALYFAPHFGQNIAKAHPGIRVGVSYIARIEEVQVAETWKEFFNMVVSVRGKAWWNSHKFALEPLRAEWGWTSDSTQKGSFLFLSPPRLVFNPPIPKGKLQKGKGWLSKRTFSYDQFFQAWGC